MRLRREKEGEAVHDVGAAVVMLVVSGWWFLSRAERGNGETRLDMAMTEQVGNGGAVSL